jgi:hypothetical protein
VGVALLGSVEVVPNLGLLPLAHVPYVINMLVRMGHFYSRWPALADRKCRLCPRLRAITKGSEKGKRSDDPLIYVTPTLARVMLQRDGDGMVGLLIVRFGVLVGGVVGAGHPAAGEAQPQLEPVVPAGQALLAAGRVWLDGVGEGEVAAGAPLDRFCLMAACSCHQSLASGRTGEGVVTESQPRGRAGGNGQHEQG